MSENEYYFEICQLLMEQVWYLEELYKTARDLLEYRTGQYETLSAELQRAEAKIEQLRVALEGIKALLGPDGEYAICKADGSRIWLADDMIVSSAFEKADNALAETADD